MESKDIKRYWEDRATSELERDAVTLRDLNQRQLEIDTICRYLLPDDRALEVGCGNGYSTAIIARFVNSVTAIDYSEAMIRRARKEIENTGNIQLMVGDVLHLPLSRRYFDVAIVERCLINLPSWELQLQAIINLASVIKTGGRMLLIEGSQDGLDHLNILRERFGLSPIIPIENNLNFREDMLIGALQEYFEVRAVHRFGLYDFLTRIFHPLLTFPAEPDYKSAINTTAAALSREIDGFEDISRLIGLVLKRR
ncbi:MAG: class I SAM-dependent methyltransferase [Syntrophales bacterium]